MIKYIAIAVFVGIGILDMLLILGCAKLERMKGADDDIDNV